MKERIETEALETVNNDMSSAAPKRNSVLKTAIIAVASTSLFALALVTLNNAVFAHAADGGVEVEYVLGDEEKVTFEDEVTIEFNAEGFSGATLTLTSEVDELGNEGTPRTSIEVIIPSLDDASVTIDLHPYLVVGGDNGSSDVESDHYIGSPATHHMSAADAIIRIAEHIAEHGVNVDGMRGDLTFFNWREGPYTATWEGSIACDNGSGNGFMFVLNATTGEVIMLGQRDTDEPFED